MNTDVEVKLGAQRKQEIRRRQANATKKFAENRGINAGATSDEPAEIVPPGALSKLSVLYFAWHQRPAPLISTIRAGSKLLNLLIDQRRDGGVTRSVGRHVRNFQTRHDLFSRIARRSANPVPYDANSLVGRQSVDSLDATPNLMQRIQGAAICVVTWPPFEHTVMVLIAANCVMLALFNPTAPPNSRMASQLETTELAFNIVFTVEMVLRIVSLGSVYSYLSNPWNLFDAVMVLAGYSQFIPTGAGSTGGIRALRAVRALRPLRTITRFSSLRAIVVCFLEALPLLATLMVFLMFLFFLFALGGMLLFQEAFHNACVNDATGVVAKGEVEGSVRACGFRACPEGYTCQQSDDAYPSTAPGFDNIGLAMLTVFQVTTISGWSYTMYQCSDGVHPAALVYFVAIIFLCSYFVINLFLAVLKRKFGTAQQYLQVSEEPEPKLERKMQYSLRSTMVKTMKLPRKLLQDYFNSATRMSRVLAAMQMIRSSTPGAMSLASAVGASQLEDESQPPRSITDAGYEEPHRWWPSCINAFTSHWFIAKAHDSIVQLQKSILFENLFMAVVAFDTVALLYVSDNSKKFDFAVVVLTTVDGLMSLEALLSGRSGSQPLRSVRVLRSLRVLHVLKFFRRLKSLRKISDVLVQSMASFIAIGLLGLLFMLVFAIIGLHVFGGALPSDEFPNFNTFFNSFLSIFQLLTLEDWEKVLANLVAATNWGSAIYVLAWIVIGHYVVLTLFLAVILEAFESAYDEDTEAEVIVADVVTRAALQGETPLKSALVKPKSFKFDSNAADGVTARGASNSVAVSIAFADAESDDSSKVNRCSHIAQFQMGSAAQSRSRRSIRFSEGPEATGIMMRRLVSNSDYESDHLVPRGNEESIGATNRLSNMPRTSHNTQGQRRAGAVGESSDRRTKAELRQAAVAAIVNIASPGDLTNYPCNIHPAHTIHAHDSWQQSSFFHASNSPHQHVAVASTITAAAERRAGMTAECTTVFENDLFQGKPGHSSPASTSLPSTAARTGTHVGVEPAVADPSQRCARKAAARIQAGVEAAFDFPEHYLHEFGADVLPQIATPFGVHIGHTAGARICGPRLGPSLFPTTADVHTGLFHSEQNAEVSLFSSSQAAVICPNPSDSYEANSAALHEGPVLSRLTNALQLALRINPQVMPDELAATLAPTKNHQARIRSSSSASSNSFSATDTGHAAASRFATAPKYVPSATPLHRDREYSGAPGHHRTTSAASQAAGSARWAVLRPIPVFNSASNSESLLSHEPAPSSTADGRTDLSHLDKLQTQPVVPKLLAKWKSGFAKASLKFLQEKQPAASLYGTLRARKIALEAHECIQLVEASDHGHNALSIITDEPAYLKKLREGVEEEDSMPQGHSFGIFPPNWPPRRAVSRLVEHPHFDNFMFLCIAVSCCFMVYEHPRLKPGDLDTAVLYWGDMVLTGFFGIEVVLKMFVFGLLPYFESHTNKLDVLIVATSLVLIAAESVNIKAVKVFRVLRAVKPLRTLTHSAGMLLVLKSIAQSVAAMANVSLLLLLTFTMFGAMGMQLFSGRLYRCTDDSVASQEQCIGEFIDADGRLVDREWRNSDVNFDNILNSFIALFVTVSLDGYSDLMLRTMSIPAEKNLQPQFMSNPGASIFFIVFITVCSFCLLNLYVGVVFFQFSRIRAHAETGTRNTEDEQLQQQWLELAKLAFRTKAREIPPQQGIQLRAAARTIALSKRFDGVIMTIVCLNVFIMAVTTYDQGEMKSLVLERVNLVFSIIYMIESAIKITGFGWKFYFKSGWNKFDFFLVLASLMDLVMTTIGSSMGSGVFNILRSQKLLRVTRISRMLKLIKSFRSLQSLFVTLWISLPAFWNVGALLVLIMFMYSYLGVQLMGHIRHGEVLNVHANFDRVWTAMPTLFRTATNDEWLGLMVETMDRRGCTAASTDCGSWWAALYFCSYIIIVSIIMLNLFTAVIIESFEKTQRTEEWAVQPSAVEDFVETWADFDDDEFEAFLTTLGPPLGLPADATNTQVYKLAADLDIPLVDGRVIFLRALYELIRSAVYYPLPVSAASYHLECCINKNFGFKDGDVLVISASHVLVVRRLQTRWRLRARTAKVSRRHRFYAIRPAAICISKEDLAQNCQSNLKALKQVHWAVDSSSHSGSEVVCSSQDGMKITFDTQLNAAHNLSRNSTRHSTRRFTWMDKGSTAEASYALHVDSQVADEGFPKQSATSGTGKGWKLASWFRPAVRSGVLAVATSTQAGQGSLDSVMQ